MDLTTLGGRALRGARRAADEARSLRIAREAGLIGGAEPRKLPAMISALARYGSLGGSIAMAAVKRPDAPALTDELGTLTFAELDVRSNALANAWRKRGLRAGDGVAILARNHRGFLDATFAATKLGARVVYLNTDFAGPQIVEVSAREGTKLLVHDDEYGPFVAGVEAPLGRFRAWVDEHAGAEGETLEELIAGGDTSPPPKPEKSASVVILTSGTTGTPKGAPRDSTSSLVPIGALLSKIPFRSEEVTIISAPMFHALGFAHAILAVGLGSKMVLRRRFDPVAVAQDIEEHKATAVIFVPVMLQRLLETLAEQPRDVSSLRIAFLGGAQLGGALAERTAREIGPVVYNLYGSTEVSYATIATPEDLAVAPDCVGRTPIGSVVKILDDAGREVPTGTTGRIFVGNHMAFEGYTGGGNKEVIDGLMSTGDVGHFDSGERLFIDGRDDEMIVSGAENVFPREIEELLARHDEIVEAAAIGVPDEAFGQRLRAFVVREPGASIDEEGVKAFVKENLARYKVPREVVFIDDLPRNPTGKILKRELAKLEPSMD
jgi:fatty-acyl-CoA synthase